MAQPKVIGYTRVSTAEQADGYGLPVQEKAIRSYCRANGLRLVAVLSDEGVSGSNGLDSRHGLAEALARIERGEATGLVVYRFDRLARDFVLQETLYQRLSQQDVRVLSVKEPETEGDEALTNMVRQLLGVVAQYEKALIRGRLAAGKAAKAADRGYCGGRPAYGFRASAGELVTNADEAELVGTVTGMRNAGESYRSIATALAEKGMTTRSGGPFNPNQVRRIAQRAGVA